MGAIVVRVLCKIHPKRVIVLTQTIVEEKFHPIQMLLKIDAKTQLQPLYLQAGANLKGPKEAECILFVINQ